MAQALLEIDFMKGEGASTMTNASDDIQAATCCNESRLVAMPHLDGAGEEEVAAALGADLEGAVAGFGESVALVEGDGAEVGFVSA